MGLRIENDAIIYVACHPNFATGGTELLHQFVSKMCDLGLNAQMYYIGTLSGNPIHENFKQYNIKWANEITDSKNNILIVPETLTYLINHYRKIQKAIWWLSIDNYYVVLPKGITRFSFYRKQFKLSLKLLLGFPKDKLSKIHFTFRNPKMNITHFYQCEYAKQHLISNGVKDNLYYLSDYLNKVFLSESVDYTSFQRENYVLYNPLKGYEFTKTLIELSPDIKWVPLEKMTPIQVKTLLKKSKVYIDFGNHPGKDRFPREAAISGCCVITGMRGSAGFYEDVPLPSKYKFDDNVTNPETIIQSIRECFANYDSLINDFSTYREMILGEEAKFDSNIKEIFLCN